MIELICTARCGTCRKAVALLEEKEIAFHYREYTRETLSEAEIRQLLDLLGLRPRDVLRKHDKAYKALALTGDEPEATLIRHLAAHPTLLQRPIGLAGGRAVIGRPPENLLSLIEG